MVQAMSHSHAQCQQDQQDGGDDQETAVMMSKMMDFYTWGRKNSSGLFEHFLIWNTEGMPGTY